METIWFWLSKTVAEGITTIFVVLFILVFLWWVS